MSTTENKDNAKDLGTTTHESTPRPVDYAKIQKIAQVISIRDVTPVQFSANLRGPLRDRAMDDIPQAILVRARRAEPVETEIVLSIVEFVFRAYFGDDPALEVQGGLVVAYEGPPEVIATFDSGDLDAFAEVNGTYTAWPFVRELVGSSAARLGVTGVLLPVWRPPAELPPFGQYMTLNNVAFSERETARGSSDESTRNDPVGG